MTAPVWKVGTYISARAERQLARIHEHVTAGREVLAEQAGEQLGFMVGCPRENGFECQGVGDFGAHDVVTHCPAACWVRVARKKGECNDR